MTWYNLSNSFNNSTIPNKGNYDCDSVRISDLISINFYDCISHFLLSFSFNCKGISNTQDIVWPHCQLPLTFSKILCWASYFRLSYLYLEMWLNRVFCVWCTFIYYILNSIGESVPRCFTLNQKFWNFWTGVYGM